MLFQRIYNSSIISDFWTSYSTYRRAGTQGHTFDKAFVGGVGTFMSRSFTLLQVRPFFSATILKETEGRQREKKEEKDKGRGKGSGRKKETRERKGEKWGWGQEGEGERQREIKERGEEREES